MQYHLIALVFGYFLDLIFGDPYWLPHPIRLIGNCISSLEKKLIGAKEEKKHLNIGSKKLFQRGVLLCIVMLLGELIIVSTIIFICYKINVILMIVVESIMTYQILATKCLKDESMKVFYALRDKTIDDARYAVSMIVGRDTACLDEIGVTKATVETIAENTSDGIIAPMIYLAIGGPVLGFLYKTVNTMDSMLGYKNERYLYFGRVAAKLDDFFNFIPARISGLIVIVASGFLGKEYSSKEAMRVFKRDRFNHASPNSAQTESAYAGALGIKLAGDASYFGVVHKKPYIGDETRKIEITDIVRANRLLYASSALSLVVCMVISLFIFYIFKMLV